MLSYQHAYHAGNPADLHKHMALCWLLTLLTPTSRPISVVETHAGRGLYDLRAAEAQKTGEAAEGIDQINIDPQTPFGEAMTAIRARYGAHAYPGSPLLTQYFLRAQDRHILMELHPGEFDGLTTTMRGAGAELFFRDGDEGLRALAPMRPRHGLVLIDPSYEVKSEYGTTADLARDVAARWPEVSIMVWYPVLAAGRHLGLIDALAALQPSHREVTFKLKGGTGMKGSGLIILNPPAGTDAALDAVIAEASGVLTPA